MKFILTSLFLTIFSACASQSPRNTISDSAKYLGQSAANSLDKSTATAAAVVAAALVSTAIGEDAVSHASRITGTCFFVDGLQSTPCASTTLTLHDHLGLEVGRTNTSEAGFFFFEAKRGEVYSIAPFSKKLTLSTDPVAPWAAGTQITLRLSLK